MDKKDYRNLPHLEPRESSEIKIPKKPKRPELLVKDIEDFEGWVGHCMPRKFLLKLSNELRDKKEVIVYGTKYILAQNLTV